MPEDTFTPNLPPPSGSSEQAQKYLEKLIDLLDQEKILVTHTDLSKLDPSALQDHFYITLNDYHVEISHTKKADTGEDFYILLFNNLKQIRDGCSEKVILAYMNLSQGQYEQFKKSAQAQFDKIKAREDAKRFISAMEPIDEVLENLDNSSPVSVMPEALDVTAAPASETHTPEITIPDPIPENLTSSDSLPEIPIFNEPNSQNISTQNPSSQTPTV